MIVEETPIKDLLIIKPRIFSDSRGYFFETYNKFAFQQAGISAEFVQDNQSCSKKGTLRGLHTHRANWCVLSAGVCWILQLISGKILQLMVSTI
jgi:dTDP-4-dehydrorhamnose 3,5-epimerase